MFQSLSMGWEFTKASYGVIGRHKQLVVFPMVSALAALVVIASFLFPLLMTGALAEWLVFMNEESSADGGFAMYATAFLFYFCNYFVIVFFNTGLVACVSQVINGQTPSLSYGFSFAMKRLPQILGWALVSAFIGVILKAIEKSNERLGRLIAAILGSAWTALTFFVVPVIVMDGAGPLKAFKKSTSILRKSWGTALVSNFTMGFYALLFMFPLFLLMIVAFIAAILTKSVVGAVLSFVVLFALIMIAAAVNAAADMVLKTMLYCWAEGKSVPDYVDTDTFQLAFKRKG